MKAGTRFFEVKKILEDAGYTLSRIHGSHHIFTKAASLPISIPVHRGKVKAYYVRQVEKIRQGD
jgi:predicted RNA binding protein YcfA (HicA-like mRNA interferase family)